MTMVIQNQTTRDRCPRKHRTTQSIIVQGNNNIIVIINYNISEAGNGWRRKEEILTEHKVCVFIRRPCDVLALIQRKVNQQDLSPILLDMLNNSIFIIGRSLDRTIVLFIHAIIIMLRTGTVYIVFSSYPGP